MTVAELISELQALPSQHAQVCVNVDVSTYDSLGPAFEAVEVDDVRNEGPYVLLRTR